MSGVLYLIIDEIKYRDYAYASIFSLRKSGYAGQITCLTNIDLRFNELNVNVKAIDVVGNNVYERSRSIKTQLNIHTPYDKTLFLDCDTLVLQNVNDVFSIDGFSVAIDIRPLIGNLNVDDIKQSIDELDYTKLAIGNKATYYSSSTILWDKADALFENWNMEWNKFKKLDQMALARAINNKHNITIMDKKYNFPSDLADSYHDALNNGAKIFAVWGPNRDKKVLQYAKENNFWDSLESI